MQLSGSMPEYLVWITKQQADLVDKIPEKSRPGYQYFGPSVLAKTIMKTIPSDYITTVQNLKQNSMVLAKIDALENRDDPPVESEFGEDWIPELFKVEEDPHCRVEGKVQRLEQREHTNHDRIGWDSYTEVLGLRPERPSARVSDEPNVCALKQQRGLGLLQ
jgi:hypothetical protein